MILGAYVKTDKGNKVHTIHKIHTAFFSPWAITICGYDCNIKYFKKAENPAPADLCQKCEAIKTKKRSKP